MTPRERLRESLVRLTNAPRSAEFRAAEEAVDALDAYLASRGQVTMRDRILTAVGVTYAECRTGGGGGDPHQAGLMRRREEALEFLLNDGWVLDRLAGLVERG